MNEAERGKNMLFAFIFLLDSKLVAPLNLPFLCLFKLLDEFPQTTVFKPLAVSSW